MCWASTRRSAIRRRSLDIGSRRSPRKRGAGAAGAGGRGGCGRCRGRGRRFRTHRWCGARLGRARRGTDADAGAPDASSGAEPSGTGADAGASDAGSGAAPAGDGRVLHPTAVFAAASRWTSTSPFVIRPSLPVPVIPDGSRSCSPTSRRTAGLRRPRPAAAATPDSGTAGIEAETPAPGTVGGDGDGWFDPRCSGRNRNPGSRRRRDGGRRSL